MDHSSDESFVWTKASTGSDDSDEMHLTMNHDESEDDDIKMKNEIQSSQNEQDKHNEFEKESKTNKRKHSVETDGTDSPKKKKFKTEPDSDADKDRKKKKKKKHKDVANGSLEDDYLNMRVKQEEKEYYVSSDHAKSYRNQCKLSESTDVHSLEVDEIHQTEKKSKKKKKHSITISENGETAIVNGENYFNNMIMNNDEDLRDITKKSPKKKKHKEKSASNHEILDDTVEDEPIQEIATGVLNDHNDLVENEQHYNSELADLSTKEINISLGRNIEETFNQTDKIMNESQESKKKANTSVVTSQRMPSLSDRIKFEDEIESEIHSDSQTVIQTDDVDLSSHSKRLLKEKNNLSVIKKKSNKNLDITDDDEIYILKCPHDVDITKLTNIDLNLDSKSKIKINGETYCGHMGDSTKVNIMTSYEQEYNIKHLVPNGIIHFRKRLPKPHYYEENTMVNNQTDFIPLPETKCRHPLFGSNYEDVIHVPIERLNPSISHSDGSSSDKKKKKKHKKAHDTETKTNFKIEYDSEVYEKKPPMVEFEPDAKVKKAKKRKHNKDEQEHNTKKSKKIKLEPDSAEAWASEKAIEENLFNF